MLIRGVRWEGVFPEGGLVENVRIEEPAVVLDFVIAKTVYVGDATDDGGVITSSLFGENGVFVGKNATVVGNIQSNGRVKIGRGSKVLGNVVAGEVEVDENVTIAGNVIAEGRVNVGRSSKVGGYVASVKGPVRIEDGAEVFDVFGRSGVHLGAGVRIVDYAVYGGGRGAQAAGEVRLDGYIVRNPEDVKFRGSLNLLKVLTPGQYHPKDSLKYIEENLRSITDIRTYLERHGINLKRLELELQAKPLENLLRKMARELAQTISTVGPSITVSNTSAPVVITIGDGNTVSIKDGAGERYRTVNIVELFQRARDGIRRGDLPGAFSALVSIRDAALKEKRVPEELEKLINEVRLRIEEQVVPSGEVKELLLSLLDSAYNKMLKL